MFHSKNRIFLTHALADSSLEPGTAR